MNKNLYRYFNFNENCNLPLISFENGGSLSYGEVDYKVSQYCGYFRQIGLRKGERIIVQAEKCLDVFYLYLASLRYGAIYVPLNPLIEIAELRYFIQDSTPFLFICTEERKKEIQQIMNTKDGMAVVQTVSPDGTGSMQRKVRYAARKFRITEVGANDIACILYTPGAAEKPKGVMVSHHNLLTNGMALKAQWNVTRHDVLLHVLPFFDYYGIFAACHPAMLSGASLIFLQNFSVNSMSKQLSCSTIFMGTPAYYKRLLASMQFDSSKAAHVRLFVSGSAILSESTFCEFLQKTGHAVFDQYGTAETGVNAVSSSEAEPASGVVGLPLPDVDIRIADSYDCPLESGKIGEVQVKGDHVFAGYWKKNEETKRAFAKDGFFKTGDLGFINEKGCLGIIGRLHDRIVTGGRDVYSGEIEKVINSIEWIRESVVIGLPHPELGEEIAAFIVVKGGAQLNSHRVINFIKARLESHKVPRQTVFLEQLPRSLSGKIQKDILRSQYSS